MFSSAKAGYLMLAIGLVLLVVAAVMFNPSPDDDDITFVVPGILAWLSWTFGCFALAKAKGLSPMLARIAVITWIGVLLLIFVPSKAPAKI